MVLVMAITQYRPIVLHGIEPGIGSVHEKYTSHFSLKRQLGEWRFVERSNYCVTAKPVTTSRIIIYYIPMKFRIPSAWCVYFDARLFCKYRLRRPQKQWAEFKGEK